MANPAGQQPTSTATNTTPEAGQGTNTTPSVTGAHDEAYTPGYGPAPEQRADDIKKTFGAIDKILAPEST
ncbi:hypothetical protein EX30DRAFT_343183 [Ascodesmis nigricans]|uniref:Uncharacterized protein n=1 Tax=Ascodesmis nigricans TaxID=341454 RepID=A0A4S2MN49_9PEZI|nr:hypothetical protein EX30DRAFT_343183 [Ascodesmis nigricans]